MKKSPNRVAAQEKGIEVQKKYGPNLLTTEDFIIRAKEIYGDTYDYGSTVLTNGSRSKITYMCSIHGEVDQLANGHLSGKGCGWCAGTRKKTTPIVIREFKEVHGERYDYSSVHYTGANNPVVIGCALHGTFEQTPHGHLKGKGCSLCGRERSTAGTKKSKDDVIEKFISVYKDKYTYDKMEYENSMTPVVITCKKHGDFKKAPHELYKGVGCPLCTKDRIRGQSRSGWSFSSWEQQGKESSNFEGYSLYIIECISKSTNEHFIKVGKTFTSIAKRFNSAIAMPYKFKIVTQVYHNAYAISNLESKIHNALKGYRIEPSRSFSGTTECFDIEALSLAIELAEG
jgi:hypothetical protein